MFCPETTLEYLQDRGGQGFLDLLTTACPKSATPLLAPILISHPIFDRYLHIGEPSPPGDKEAARKAWQSQVSMDRNTFLVHFLWNTVLGIYDLEQIYHLAKPTTKHERGVATKGLAGITRAMHKDMGRVVKEAQKIGRRACTTCHKPASRLSEGVVFMKCPRCDAIGREVVYCDR